MSGGPFRVIEGGRSDEPTPGILIVGAAEVVTMAGGVRMGSAQGDVARKSASDAGGPDAPGAPVVACWEGRIAAVGPRADVERVIEADGYPLGRFARLNADGGTVTPGLIDPHTHLVFAGSREGEMLLRQRGAGYLEILAAGGGILSTVAATRAASVDQLLAHGRRWLDEMLGHGVTTVEAKSGYGLDLETEVKLVEVAHRLGAEGPTEVIPTFLGAHAVPQEFRVRPDGTEAYVRSVIEDQLPGIAAHGRALFCDVFCETGVFDAGQSRRILEAAASLGMAPRLHADELAPSGGAELAAEIGAFSADHLATPSEAGIAALA
ncbi:MAG: imidazolonepropionase, partial [Chloroflexi bacterium]|nr:imidazolonepropionase [Chloroflexota bacterium]